MTFQHGKWLTPATVPYAAFEAGVAAEVLNTQRRYVLNKVTALSVGAVSSIDVSAAVIASAINGDVKTSEKDGSELGIYVGPVVGGGDELLVKILQAGKADGIQADGDDVYGKITSPAAGQYTLSFFKASDDTAYTFPTGPTDIDYCFVEIVPLSQVPLNVYLRGGVVNLIDNNVTGDLSAHVNDASDAHAATAVSFLGTGLNYLSASADTQAALVAADGQIGTNANGISTNATGVATNASSISTNAAAIAQNASDIATNTAAISTNAGNITQNANDIAQNASDITALQNAASAWQRQRIALTPQMITDKYVDLAQIPATPANVRVVIKSGGSILFGDHFSIIDNGSSEIRRLIWDSADAAVTDGLETLLDATDVLDVFYEV